MTETNGQTPQPEKNRSRTELWVVAAVAGVSLICLSVLAVVLALILGKGSLIQVNPVINGGPFPPNGPVAVSTPIAQWTTSVPRQPADRTWPRLEQTLTLPVASMAPTGTPSPEKTETPAQRAGATATPRPLEPSPPSENLFQVRGDVADTYSGKRALPMPLRPKVEVAPSSHTSAQAPPPISLGTLYISRGVPSGAQTVHQPSSLTTAATTQFFAAVKASLSPSPSPSGKPQTSASVQAALPASSVNSTVTVRVSAMVQASPSPLPLVVPVMIHVLVGLQAVQSPMTATVSTKGSPALAPSGPCIFAPVIRPGSMADFQILSARTTKRLAGYGPSKGMLFFAAHVLIDNTGGDPLPLDGDSFDLRDSDGNSYMTVPAASGSSVMAPVLAGTAAKMLVTFLVPDDAALRSLSLVMPTETVLVPLNKK